MPPCVLTSITHSSHCAHPERFEAADPADSRLSIVGGPRGILGHRSGAPRLLRGFVDKMVFMDKTRFLVASSRLGRAGKGEGRVGEAPLVTGDDEVHPGVDGTGDLEV